MTPKDLLFHSGLVLLVGLLCGIPYGKAIARGDSNSAERWKVAHGALPIGAVVGIAIAAAIGTLGGAPFWIRATVFGWIVSNYAFCISLPLAAMSDQRGLSFEGSPANKTVAAFNTLGALSSLAGTVGFVTLAY